MQRTRITTESACCPDCGNAVKRFGKHRNGLQRFRCLSCKRTFTEEHEAPFRVEDYLKQDEGRKAIQLLLEGCSVRTVERFTGIRLQSLLKLLVAAGERCERIMESISDVPARDVQADEIWAFVGLKESHKSPEQAHDNNIGDCYTWVAIERDSKLVLAYVVGRRTLENAMDLTKKLRRATSAAHRFQLTTDGLSAYIAAVDEMLSDRCDYAQLVKVYKQPREGEQRYSPTEIAGAVPTVISGEPNPECICTSHVERQNLTMRMQIRRFTRLTNAFSKKLENHKAAVALYFAYYNFCRIHGTLRVTPAMEAGIADRVWNISDLLAA